eukprot:jgi/Bigna1/67204/fgenesh1_pg.3_\
MAGTVGGARRTPSGRSGKAEREEDVMEGTGARAKKKRKRKRKKREGAGDSKPKDRSAGRTPSGRSGKAEREEDVMEGTGARAKKKRKRKRKKREGAGDSKPKDRSAGRTPSGRSGKAEREEDVMEGTGARAPEKKKRKRKPKKREGAGDSIKPKDRSADVHPKKRALLDQREQLKHRLQPKGDLAEEEIPESHLKKVRFYLWWFEERAKKRYKSLQNGGSLKHVRRDGQSIREFVREVEAKEGVNLLYRLKFNDEQELVTVRSGPMKKKTISGPRAGKPHQIRYEVASASYAEIEGLVNDMIQWRIPNVWAEEVERLKSVEKEELLAAPSLQLMSLPYLRELCKLRGLRSSGSNREILLEILQDDIKPGCLPRPNRIQLVTSKKAKTGEAAMSKQKMVEINLISG